MIVKIDRLDIGLTLAMPSRLLPTTESSLQDFTNKRLNKGMFNRQLWEAEGKFYHIFGTESQPFGTFLMIPGHRRVGRGFYRHFGTLQKTRTKFYQHYGTTIQLLGTATQHFGTDCRIQKQIPSDLKYCFLAIFHKMMLFKR